MEDPWFSASCIATRKAMHSAAVTTVTLERKKVWCAAVCAAGADRLAASEMYVNYYDRHVKLEEEGPTVGILLYKRKNDALVEITLPEASNVHAREYSLVVPSKTGLQRKLLEWGEGQEE